MRKASTIEWAAGDHLGPFYVIIRWRWGRAELYRGVSAAWIERMGTFPSVQTLECYLYKG